MDTYGRKVAQLRKKAKGSEAVPSTEKPPLDWPKLLEPSDFDYEVFFLHILPSDVRFGKLFSGLRLRTTRKDPTIGIIRQRGRSCGYISNVWKK